MLIVPREDEKYAVYNPDTCAVAYITIATLNTLLYLEVPHTIDGLWSRISKKVGVKYYDEFCNNIMTLMEDRFVVIEDDCHTSKTLVSGMSKIVPDKPVHVVVHTTYRCNLQCSYSYNKDVRSATIDEMTYSEWSDVFDEVADARVKSVVISGGEPMIRRDLFPLVEKLKARGVRTILGTNGTLINNDDICSIKRSFSSVSLSIDSVDEKINDLNRGVGTFAKTVSVAKMLTSSGIEWKAQMVFNARTFKLHKETDDFVRELGAQELVVSVDTSSDEARKHRREYALPKYWALAGKSTPIKLATTCDSG